MGLGIVSYSFLSHLFSTSHVKAVEMLFEQGGHLVTSQSLLAGFRAWAKCLDQPGMACIKVGLMRVYWLLLGWLIGPVSLWDYEEAGCVLPGWVARSLSQA